MVNKKYPDDGSLGTPHAAQIYNSKIIQISPGLPTKNFNILKTDKIWKKI